MKFLYHGTSGKIAKRILNEGIIPNGTESFTLRVSEAGTFGAKRIDPSLVYLMDIPFMAIPFGWVRVVGDIVNGHLKVLRKRKKYDDVVLFGIAADALNPALLTQDGLGWKCEVTHAGIIPASALRTSAYFPMSNELEVFASTAIHGGDALKQYIGIDLVEYLHGKQFDVSEPAEEMVQP